MRVVYFDLLHAQPMDGTKFHGGGEYIKSIFKALSAEYVEKCELHILYNPKIFIDEWIINIINNRAIEVHYVESARDIVQILNGISTKVDACFFTGMIYKYANIDLPLHILRIGVCHGLRPIEKLYDTEEWRYIKRIHDWKEYVRSILRKNHAIKMLELHFESIIRSFDVIVTVSEHSKFSLMRSLSNLNGKIKLHVFYTPLKHIENGGYAGQRQSGGNTDYILMISANRWLKNAYRGIKAVDDLYDRKLLDIKCKVLGGLPDNIRNTVKHKEMFEFVDYVSTEELEEAYRNCAVFFYPTLNEGFGLPPMEAMKYGKTCVISGVCSLPEIYGESVYYCNPYDIGEMSNRILLAVNKPISVNTINDRMNTILKRQISDTDELCKLIIG